MRYYTGLDVSNKTTAICTLDEARQVVFECETVTDPKAILHALQNSGFISHEIALESGGLSHWLVDELSKLGLPVICIDSRKMSKLLSININKTDKNDARQIADALRCNYYSKVAQKDQASVEIGILLATRATLLRTTIALKNTVRGHLKTFGLRLGSVSHKKFELVVKTAITNLSHEVQISIIALLNAYVIAHHECLRIETKIAQLAKDDEDVQLLCTIPGVGILSALTFKVHVGDPRRFKNSRAVGAFFGMTPTQYSSGETTRHGKVSKCGAEEVRTILNDAATSLLYCVKSWSKLKAWSLKIRKKKGHKTSTMAVGRKLCVIMHSMLISRKPFEYGTPPLKQNQEKGLKKAV